MPAIQYQNGRDYFNAVVAANAEVESLYQRGLPVQAGNKKLEIEALRSANAEFDSAFNKVSQDPRAKRLGLQDQFSGFTREGLDQRLRAGEAAGLIERNPGYSSYASEYSADSAATTKQLASVAALKTAAFQTILDGAMRMRQTDLNRSKADQVPWRAVDQIVGEYDGFISTNVTDRVLDPKKVGISNPDFYASLLRIAVAEGYGDDPASRVLPGVVTSDAKGREIPATARDMLAALSSGEISNPMRRSLAAQYMSSNSTIQKDMENSAIFQTFKSKWGIDLRVPMTQQLESVAGQPLPEGYAETRNLFRTSENVRTLFEDVMSKSSPLAKKAEELKTASPTKFYVSTPTAASPAPLGLGSLKDKERRSLAQEELSFLESNSIANAKAKFSAVEKGDNDLVAKIDAFNTMNVERYKYALGMLYQGSKNRDAQIDTALTKFKMKVDPELFGLSTSATSSTPQADLNARIQAAGAAGSAAVESTPWGTPKTK